MRPGEVQWSTEAGQRPIEAASHRGAAWERVSYRLAQALTKNYRHYNDTKTSPTIAPLVTKTTEVRANLVKKGPRKSNHGAFRRLL